MDNHHFLMGKSTMSTGPLSSSQIAKLPEGIYTIKKYHWYPIAGVLKRWKNWVPFLMAWKVFSKGSWKGNHDTNQRMELKWKQPIELLPWKLLDACHDSQVKGACERSSHCVTFTIIHHHSPNYSPVNWQGSTYFFPHLARHEPVKKPEISPQPMQ